MRGPSLVENPIKSVEQAFNSVIKAATGILKAAFSNFFASSQKTKDKDADPTSINPNLKTEVFKSFKTEVTPEISNKEGEDLDQLDQKGKKDLKANSLTTQYDANNQPVQNASSENRNEADSNPTQKLITDIHTILRKK